MKAVFLICLLFAAPASAISTAGLSKKLSFTRGVYKAVKGSNPACVSGKFEIFEADGKVFHMKAAESVFASNVHTKKFKSEDESCSMEYSTKIIKNGFINTEVMECLKPDTFYRRALKIQTKGAKMIEYSLNSQDSKKAKMKSLRCRLDLVKKY